jgi:pimeloyl-ACP methyl ester carboxylesterase
MDLHFAAYGSGPPLIILHGLLGSGDNWVTVSRRLAGHNRVFAVDARNHGRSPHDPRCDLKVMAEDVVDFMGQHDLVSSVLLGHSMGGKTAMQIALTRPERVGKLIVVDIAPREYPHDHDELLDALDTIDLARFRERVEVEEALTQSVPRKAVRQFLVKNLRRDESGGLVWKMNLPVIRENYAAIAGDVPAKGEFRGPTLFIRGDRSSYVRDDDREPILKIFPTGRIHTIPGAGHWVHADAPEEFVTVVGEFLRE